MQQWLVVAQDKDARFLLYFSAYTLPEAMPRDALSDVNEGIRVGARLIRIVRYEDDQATLWIKCRKTQKSNAWRST